MRMRTTIENGVLSNGQQLGRAIDNRVVTYVVYNIYGRAENSFIDQGKFVAMKSLSGCKAPRCDKHQFCDKMTVST